MQIKIVAAAAMGDPLISGLWDGGLVGGASVVASVTVSVDVASSAFGVVAASGVTSGTVMLVSAGLTV